MVTESDIAELLGSMNVIADAFLTAKLKAHAEFVGAIRGLVQHYFQEHPLPVPVLMLPGVRVKQMRGVRAKRNVGSSGAEQNVSICTTANDGKASIYSEACIQYDGKSIE